MVSLPNEETLKSIRANGRAAALTLRLPFRSNLWQGIFGNWAGTGLGSSIDFLDHRPYLPGDDPRYIDWQAYARSGTYSMKLYREEVSPRLDLVLDVSESMLYVPEKANRTLELFFFLLESALRNGSSVRSRLVGPGACRDLSTEEAVAGTLPIPEEPAGGDPFDILLRTPFQTASLRVLVSDLLYPGSPEAFFRHWISGKGRVVVLAPFLAREVEPDWQGNMELVDCETAERRLQDIDDSALGRYRDAYRRHFDLWREQARRHNARFARLPAGGSLPDALRTEAVSAGAVEPWA